jgi:hypothetical protein
MLNVECSQLTIILILLLILILTLDRFVYWLLPIGYSAHIGR